jgi:hypothetical protein
MKTGVDLRWGPAVRQLTTFVKAGSVPAAAHEQMRNLSLGTVQFTHKIIWAAGKAPAVRHGGACTILVHAYQYALFRCAAHRFAADLQQSIVGPEHEHD